MSKLGKKQLVLSATATFVLKQSDKNKMVNDPSHSGLCPVSCVTELGVQGKI